MDLNLAYSNRRSVRFSYGSETGRSAELTVSVIDPHLGGRFRDLWVRGVYTEFLRMPWRGHQVLALRWAGGASAGGMTRRAPFYIGGFSPQSDVLRSFLLRSAFTDAGTLRGYQPAAFEGEYYAVMNVEYRAPLADIERGIGTVPAFIRRITLIPFFDVGGAWLENEDFRWWQDGRLKDGRAAWGAGFTTYFLGIPWNVDFARPFDGKSNLGGWKTTFYVGPGSF